MGIKDQYLDERFTTTVVQHPHLPFFHCCEGVYLQSILDGCELKPRNCPVYNEDLLYLFYGKPAYKSSESLSSSLNFLMPICFVVNYEAICDIERAVAFDSGAFDKYSDYMHKSMERKEFEISPNKDSLNKMVHYFFANNKDYFHGKAKSELEPYDAIHYQIESYHSIITSRHRQEIDDRKGTIEVQLKYSIQLTKDTIDAIILPTFLAQSNHVKSILGPLGIPVIEISNYGNVSRDYYIHILEKVKEHLITKNLLHGN